MGDLKALSGSEDDSYQGRGRQTYSTETKGGQRIGLSVARGKDDLGS